MDAINSLTRRSGLALLLAAAMIRPASAAAKPDEITYGADKRQRLDIFPQPTLTNAPILIFAHGGAWDKGDKRDVADLPAFAAQNGFLLISAGYRFPPEADAAESAKDIASVVAWAKDNAAAHGGDPTKIYLLGSFSGGAFIALVGVDPRYLAAHNMAPKDLAGVICLDGAAYLARQDVMAFDQARRPNAAMMAKSFETNPDGLSPAMLTKRGVDYPPFLIFYANDRADSPPQAREMAQALRQAGGKVSIRDVRDDNHAELFNHFGQNGNASGELAVAFIRTGELPPNDVPPVGSNRRARGDGKMGLIPGAPSSRRP